MLDLGIGRERRVRAEVASNALDRSGLDRRSDVVDDELCHRALRLRRHHDPEQTAHRGADPVDRLGAAAGDEGGQRGQVRRKDVIVRIREPVALAATRHVDGEHAVRRRQSLAEHVEVAGVTPNAVHADYDVRFPRIAPFEVNDFVKSVRRQAAKAVATRLRCSERHGGIRGRDEGSDDATCVIGAIRQGMSGERLQPPSRSIRSSISSIAAVAPQM